MTAHSTVRRVGAADLARQLALRIGELACALVGAEPTSRCGDELRFRSRGSLAVCVKGPKRGSWYDHEAGVGGDALALVLHLRGGSMHDALEWSRAWLGLGVGGAARAPSAAAAVGSGAHRGRGAPETLPLARCLWAEAIDAAGTPAAAYLRSRGLELPQDAPLRFRSDAWRNPAFGPRGPAMLALMTAPEAHRPVGVHVTYLRPDGGGKAAGKRPKIMLGNAGVVRLVPDSEVTIGLGLAEGIETSLSVIQRAGWSPVWAACSAGGIGRFPVLPGVEALTIFVDNDDGGAGEGAAEACARRWVEAGRTVRVYVPPAGHDFNDAPPVAGRAA